VGKLKVLHYKIMIVKMMGLEKIDRAKYKEELSNARVRK